MRREEKEEVKFLCTKCGKGVVQVQARHTCKASDMETVRGMVEALPRELKGKLALALLREVKEGQGHLQAQDGGAQALVLPQVHGGPPTLVHMGTTSDPPPPPTPPSPTQTSRIWLPLPTSRADRRGQ